MKNQESQGTYSVKDTGEEITYSFEYQVIDSVQDAVDSIGEEKVKALVQRMLKVDANNVAREKAKTENGHSTRVALTEEQKSERKASRQADKQLLKAIKDKNLSLSDLENL